MVLNELRTIQKDRENWKCNIDLVADYLNEIYPVNVKAKALWMIGEMGLIYPGEVEKHVDTVAKFLENENPKLRERSINAHGESAELTRI